MFRLACLFIIVNQWVYVFGQDNTSNENIDSLRKNSLQLLRTNEYARADSVLSILIKRKDELDPILIPTVYNNKGIALYGIGEYTEGITQYKKALFIYKETDRDTMYAQALVNLGMAYKEIGAHTLASQSLYKAVDKFQLMGLKKEESAALNSLGNLYRDAKNYARAEYYFKKSLALRESIDYQKGIAYSYHGLGRLMLEKKDFKKAKTFLFQSLQMKKDLGLDSKSASTLAQLGVLYLELNMCDSAEFYMNLSIAVREKATRVNTLQLALNNLHLGEIHLKCGVIDKSCIYLELAAQILTELNASKDLLLVYESLTKVYEKQLRYQDAYTISLKQIELKEKVLSEKNQKELAKLSIEYDVKGYKRKIELKRIENDYLAKRNLIFLTASIALTVLLLIALLLFRQSTMRKRKIKFQNDSLTIKNQNILALHSELSHRTNNFFSLIRAMILNDKNKSNAVLIEEQLSRIDAMSEVQKHLIVESSSSVSKVALVDYIKELVEQGKLLFDLEIEFEQNIAPNNAGDLTVSYDTAARLGIIINELITNTKKHNQAIKGITSRIKFQYSESNIQIEYSDSGEIQLNSRDKGQGLLLIEQLILPLQGQILFDFKEHFIAKISVPTH